jgi:hypothetical protein
MDKTSIDELHSQIQVIHKRINDLRNPIFILEDGWDPQKRMVVNGVLSAVEMLEYWRRLKHYYKLEDLEIIRNAEMIIHTFVVQQEKIKIQIELLGVALNGLIPDEVPEIRGNVKAQPLITETVKESVDDLPGFEPASDSEEEKDDDNDEPEVELPEPTSFSEPDEET